MPSLGGFAGAMYDIGQTIREDSIRKLEQNKQMQERSLKMLEAISSNEGFDPRVREETMQLQLESGFETPDKFNPKKTQKRLQDIVGAYYQRAIGEAEEGTKQDQRSALPLGGNMAARAPFQMDQMPEPPPNFTQMPAPRQAAPLFDPQRADRAKMQREQEALRQGVEFFKSQGADDYSALVLATGGNPGRPTAGELPKPMILSQGQQAFDPQGRVIASVPPAEKADADKLMHVEVDRQWVPATFKDGVFRTLDQKLIPPGTITRFSTTVPNESGDGSFQEQMYTNYVQEFTLKNGRPPDPTERIALRNRLLDDEAKARTPDELDSIRRLNIALLGRLVSTPGVEDLKGSVRTRVSQVADRVEAGELTMDQGIQTLGGQRGALGPALMDELTRRDSRIIPPTRREAINAVNTGIGLLDTLDKVVNDVINAKTPAERAKATLILEDFGSQIAARLSKAAGEVGALSNPDVQRAISLVPGWKSANFDPDYARREMALMRTTFQNVKNQLLNFETFQRGNAPLPTPPSGAGGGSFSVTAPNGKTYTFPSQQAADEFKRKAGIR